MIKKLYKKIKYIGNLLVTKLFGKRCKCGKS